MVHTSKISALLLGILLLGSCMKKELPAPPHNPGDVITATAEMEEDYKWQIYYSLSKGTVVGKNLKKDWDIAFSTATDGYQVITNTSRMVFVYKTNKQNFSSVMNITDTTGAGGGKIDSPTGSLDSTAIGDWRQDKSIFILKNNENQAYKLQLLEVTGNSYTVKFAKLNGDNEKTMQIAKDSNYNFTFLSLNDGATKTVEPPKNTWDIVFTGYTHIFYSTNTPYMVTGCLLNRYNTSAIKESKVPFEQITYTNIGDFVLSTDINAIGYDWKEYSLENGTYVTFPNMNYIIKDAQGVYYKLHFIDFSKDGVKGYPKWEFQKL